MEQSRVLIVDDQGIYREPLAMALSSSGFSVTVAEDGRDALLGLELQMPDLVILDMIMPKVDGLAFLARLRANPEWRWLPVIVLTEQNNSDDIKHAAKFGISGYLSKADFSIRMLLSAVDGVLRETPSKNIGEFSPIAENRARNITQAPLPLEQRVFLEAKAEETNRAMLALLNTHPHFAPRALGMANSKIYGPNDTQCQYATINEAVTGLGMPTMHGILCMVAIADFISSQVRDGPWFELWEHAVAVSSLMERLVHRPDAETLQLGRIIGFCHDLAEIPLRETFRQDHSAAEEYAIQSGKSLLEARREILPFLDYTLSERLLSELGLPAAMSRMIVEYQALSGVRPTEKCPWLVKLLHLADNFAHGMLCTWSNAVSLELFGKDYFLQLLGTSSPAAFDLRSYRKSVRAATIALLGIETEIAIPIKDIPPNASVWYARHKRVGVFEPIGLACESSATVAICPRLPAYAGALQGYHRLIVAVPEISDDFSLYHSTHLLASLPDTFRLLYICESALAEEEIALLGDRRVAVYKPPIPLYALLRFLNPLSN